MSSSISNRINEKLRCAFRVLQREHREIVAELTAFRKFKRNIEDISPSPMEPSPKQGINVQVNSGEDEIDKIETAYKETVMAVPHYDKEYGDTYFESITAEFGPEMAVRLSDSNYFAPAHKLVLLGKIDDIVKQRQTLKDIVELEQSSIKSAKNKFKTIGGRIESLPSQDFRTCKIKTLEQHLANTTELIEKCDTIASNRQEEIARRENRLAASTEVGDLHSYFYQSHDFNFPILSSLGYFGDILYHHQEKIEIAISEKNNR